MYGSPLRAVQRKKFFLLRLNAEIIKFKRNDYCVQTQKDIFAFNRKLLCLKNNLRLNTKIIAIKNKLMRLIAMFFAFKRIQEIYNAFCISDNSISYIILSHMNANMFNKNNNLQLL